MKPIFKSELECIREEKRGIIFYRIDTPGDDSSFRLYEIEYLISQCLDGSRALDDVIAHIKTEHQFDLNRADLEKLVLQLDSMGFLEEGSIEGLSSELSAGQDLLDEAAANPPPEDELEPIAAVVPDLPKPTKSSPKDGRDTVEMKSTFEPEPVNALQILVMGSILAVVAGGAVWLGWHYLLGGSDFAVRTQVLSPSRIPLYFAESPTSIATKNEKWLAFKNTGPLGTLSVANGDRVKKGAVLGALKLPKRLQKKYSKVLAKVRKEEEKATEIAEKLEALFEEQSTLARVRDEVREKVQSYADGKSDENGDLADLKKEHVSINNQLSQLSQREQRIRKKEKRVKAKYTKEAKKLSRFYRSHSGKFLLAPFGGTITEVREAEGTRIKKGQPILKIVDDSEWILNFPIQEKSFQKGGRVFVSFERGVPTPGLVTSIAKTEKKKGLVITVSGFKVPKDGTEPNFRLVRDFVDPAFIVPANALAQTKNLVSSVFVVQEGKASSRKVKVVQERGEEVVVSAAENSLQENDHLIIEILSGEAVHEIENGQEVTVSEVKP